MDDRKDWVSWEGIEVEGRLQGIRTFFIQAKSKRPMPYDKFGHFFFLKEFYLECGFDQIREALKHVIVSIETTPELIESIPEDVFVKAHILLAIMLPQRIQDLKSTDTVRLDMKNKKYNVWTTCVQNFFFTGKDDYEIDKMIESKSES